MSVCVCVCVCVCVIAGCVGGRWEQLHGVDTDPPEGPEAAEPTTGPPGRGRAGGVCPGGRAPHPLPCTVSTCTAPDLAHGCTQLDSKVSLCQCVVQLVL